MEKINTRKAYKTIGYVKTEKQTLAILDIPVMSDEKWETLALESAIKHLTAQGIEPTEANLQQYWQNIRDENAKIHGTPMRLPEHLYAFGSQKNEKAVYIVHQPQYTT